MTKPLNELELYTYCPHCGNELSLSMIDGEKVKKCSICGFTFWNNPKPAVSVIVHKNKKILMLKRRNEPFKDFWVLPGGFINYEETAQQAARREVKEEAGLSIDLGEVVSIYRIDTDPRGIHIDIIFSAASHGEISLSKEDSQWQYFSVQELPENIAYKHREAIQDWAKPKS